MNAKEIIRTMELNPNWRIQRGAGESKWMLCHKDTIAPGLEWAISDRSFNALKKQNRFMRDAAMEAYFKAYGVDVTVYMLANASIPADEPVADIGTMTDDADVTDTMGAIIDNPAFAAEYAAKQEADTAVRAIEAVEADDEAIRVRVIVSTADEITPELKGLVGIAVDQWGDGRMYSVVFPEYPLSAFSMSAHEFDVVEDEPTDTASAIEAAEAGTLKVGDRVEVVASAYPVINKFIGSQGSIYGISDDFSYPYGVEFDTPVDDNESYAFYADELRKLDAPTRDPLAAAGDAFRQRILTGEHRQLDEAGAVRDELARERAAHDETTKRWAEEVAEKDAEIARLQAEVNRLAACDTMLTQGLADVFNENERVYVWELGAVQNVRNALNLKREVINDLRQLLADVDNTAPANTSAIEDEGFQQAIDNVREYRYLHNLS